MDVRNRVRYHSARVRSLATRRQAINKYLASAAPCKVHFGCGLHQLPGWLNTDLLANSNVLYLDATQRLPFPSGSIDYVFSEHMFEHIHYPQGADFLREVCRVLRPGGKIRIATPDLAFLVRLYSEPKDLKAQRYIKYSVDHYSVGPCTYLPAVVLNTFFYSWHHRFIYDRQTLEETLLQSGFQGVTFRRPGESDDPQLQGLEEHGQLIGEEFNLMETMVVEATRPGSIEVVR